jgi:hypothetical protein
MAVVIEDRLSLREAVVELAGLLVAEEKIVVDEGPGGHRIWDLRSEI